MPLLEPDLSDVGPIQPGTYTGKILTAEAKTSKSGNQMSVHKISLNVNGKSRERDVYLVVAGKGAYGFFNLLKACGFRDIADRMAAGEKVQFDNDQLIGQEVNCVVEPDTYNDSPSDKIASFLPL